MIRPSREQTGLELAGVWAKRGTCSRRQVGCVLFDRFWVELSSGYNGPAAGEPHCFDTPCPGAGLPTGTGLELCEAIHAEANALLKCPDVRQIYAACITHSPCLHCVKLLKNTGCQRIIFKERYAHDAPSEALWTRGKGSRRWNGDFPMTYSQRSWEHIP